MLKLTGITWRSFLGRRFGVTHCSFGTAGETTGPMWKSNKCPQWIWCGSEVVFFPMKVADWIEDVSSWQSKLRTWVKTLSDLGKGKIWRVEFETIAMSDIGWRDWNRQCYQLLLCERPSYKYKNRRTLNHKSKQWKEKNRAGEHIYLWVKPQVAFQAVISIISPPTRKIEWIRGESCRFGIFIARIAA